MKPSVSVALCTYNGSQHLLEQLQSIAQQTLLPVELVVCDDGSTDGTLSMLDAFTRTAGFPVRLHKNERNLGTTRNFEQAIALCQGEFIALCDQDDAWQPEKLATLADAMRGGEVGGVFSDGLLMNESSVLTAGRLWQAHQLGDLTKGFGEPFDQQTATSILLRNDVVTGATLMFCSALRDRLRPFPAEWIHDGWLAWMLVLHSSLRAVTDPLICYRVHSVQQVGVPDYSVVGKLRQEGSQLERRKALYGSQWKKFETLLAHVDEQPGGRESRLHDLIAAKCSHLRHRAALPTGRLSRCRTILSEAGSYREFSRGWKSMLLDATA